MDIKKLVNATDPREKNANIIELDTYICELCEYGEKIDNLTEPQKNFFYNQELEREINNGGFDQYFFNTSGNYTHETVNSLILIGANKTADILQKAINQFPNKTVPKDRNERQLLLDQIREQSEAIWHDLDDKFYAYEDDLNTLNLNYIKQNIEEFLEK
jgi:hypothetical protein